MSWILLPLGIFLIARPLPTLLMPQQRDRTDFVTMLESFVDQSRAGLPTPLALKSALEIDFLPTEALSDFITARYVDDQLASQFALMWKQLARRGGGVVAGAALLSEIGRARASQDEELDAKTAGARATFRLLILLPVWFLVAGQLVGLPALSILLSHTWGYILIAFATGLMWLTHLWMQGILAAV